MTEGLGRALLLVVLLGGAALAVERTTARFDASDRERALHIARTARFAPDTRATVAWWLLRTRPGALAEWTADVESRFAGRVRVTLRAPRPDGEPPDLWRWRVHLRDRRVEPLDEATRAVQVQVAAAAAEAASE